MQIQLDNEKAVLKQLESNYEDALGEINSKIELLMARQDADMQHVIYQVEYQKALRTQVQAILETLQANEFTTIAEYLAKSYEDGFIGTMYDMHGQGVPLIFPINQKAVVAAIQNDIKLKESLYTELGHDITDLKKKITGEISRGLSSGQMYSEISRNVASWARIPKNRAKTITRTEGHRILCKATADAQHKAKEKGADVVKQWDSTLDGATRDSHRAVDGEIAELEDTFSNGLEYPGDPKGKAEEVINCRCALLQRARWALGNDYTKWSEDAPVIMDDDGTTQFAIIEAKNYEDFKKQYKQASERVREGAQKMKQAESIEEVNAEGSKMLADAYERHRIENNLTSTSYEQMGEFASKVVSADYKNMSVESASVFNKTITELATEYDTPLQKVRTMTKEEAMGNPNFASVFHSYSTDSAELIINPIKCKDVGKLADRIREHSKNGYCASIPDEAAEKYIATHEFAHTLLNLEQPLSNKTNWVNADYAKIKKVRKEVVSVYDEYMNAVRDISERQKKAELAALTTFDETAWKEAAELASELKRVKISNYSLESADEFMAEAFANEKIGTTSNEYARRVLDILDKNFKG